MTKQEKNGIWIDKRKRQAIHYILWKCLEWIEELGEDKEQNDISVLKFLHFVFIISSADSEKDEKSILLEDIFTDFHAQPYGTIERTVKEYLMYKNLISDHRAKVIEKPKVDFDLRLDIDFRFECVKRINNNMIKLPAFDLVDKNRKNWCWQITYNKGLKKNTLNEKIPMELIKCNIHQYYYE